MEAGALDGHSAELHHVGVARAERTCTRRRRSALDSKPSRGALLASPRERQGATVKINPPLRDVVFGAGGSRNQPWAQTVSPPTNG